MCACVRVCVGERPQTLGPLRLRSGVWCAFMNFKEGFPTLSKDAKTTYSLFLTFGRVIWTGDADVDVGDRGGGGGGGDGCRDWHAQQTWTGTALRVHWVPVAHPRQ